MLDLDPAVDLQEVRLAGGGIDHELGGSEVAVADRLGERHRGGAQRGPGLRCEVGRRCLLDDLLKAALDRAVALAQVEDRAVLVGGDLDLDVARGLDQLLQVDPIIAERAPGLAPGEAEERIELVLAVNALDPATPSPAGRLDQQRVTDLGRQAARLGGVGRLGTGEDGGAGPLRLRPGGELVAGQLDRRRRRSDEHEPVAPAPGSPAAGSRTGSRSRGESRRSRSRVPPGRRCRLADSSRRPARDRCKRRGRPGGRPCHPCRAPRRRPRTRVRAGGRRARSARRSRRGWG